MSPLDKPSGCYGCALQDRGTGFATADGNPYSPLLFVGESLGRDEAYQGRPFVGAAGSMLARIFNLKGWKREDVRIHNVVNCFPGETTVLAPYPWKQFRRWYVGPMVTAHTRTGVLTGTPNHPVLTATGWKGLGELQQGDYLIRPAIRQGMGRSQPHVEAVPVTFAEAFQSATNHGGGRRVVGRDVYFHGDVGREMSEVEIVPGDWKLWLQHQSSLMECLLELILEPTYYKAGALSPAGQAFSAELLLSLTDHSPADRRVRGRSYGLSVLAGRFAHALTLGLGAGTSGDVQELQRGPNLTVADVEAALDCFRSVAAQVELCEVLGTETTNFAGHVYNLETRSHKYVANGFIVHNCQPPGDWLNGAPWQHDAIAHCAPYLDESLASPYLKVVIPMGETALRRIMGYREKKIRVQDFHGAILRDPTDRFWVTPTYHPSFLQRGAVNLIGTVLWDLGQAEYAQLHGRPQDPASLVIDPPYEWLKAWVLMVLQAVMSEGPHAFPLSIDVETPDKQGGKDEGEITEEDRSFTILRVNVAINPDEGITFPFIEPFISLLKELLAGGMDLWLWNKAYDIPRLLHTAVLEAQGVDLRAHDLMWYWHILQSDLPRGLGFAAPFYSTFGPWKHLADAEPAYYGAVDGLQTHRCGMGIISDLHRLNLWDTAHRHVHLVHAYALKPAQDVGVRIDRERLLAFKADLGVKATTKLDVIQATVPESLRPLTPKGGLVHRPLGEVLHVKASAFTRKGKKRAGREGSEIKYDLYKKSVVVERSIEKEVWVCRGCAAVDVPKRHRCKPREEASGDDAVGAAPPVPDLVLATQAVTRYFWQEPFNPDSPQQVLAYIHHRKHTPGRAKKTQKDSTNREALERLVRTGDPFYPALLDYRAIMKVKGTYVDGTERRLDAADRVHPEPTFRPSTHRLSYVNPNITNVVADKGGKESLAAGFRRCVIPFPSTRFLEADFSGSESVDFGWFCRDPNFIRLAKLGVHAALASYILGKPYDPTWSDEDLGAYFKAIKKAGDRDVRTCYDRSKRFIHGFSYGLSLQGMVLQFPELFPTLKVAQQYANLFNTLAPNAATFQRTVRERAFKQHYLGGPGDHPFGYKHWFWSVFAYSRITWAQYQRLVAKFGGEDLAPVAIINGTPFRISLGEDGKRVVAFYPQSTTAGKLKEVMLRLFTPGSPSYIGEVCDGVTPLRAPIHDSLLLEIPTRSFDLVASLVFREMQRPFTQLPMPAEWGLGEYLATGIAAKTGKPGASWAEMDDLHVPSFSELGVGSDVIITAAEPEEQEDVDDLARTA